MKLVKFRNYLHYPKGSLIGDLVKTVSNIELKANNYTIEITVLRNHYQNNRWILKTYIKTIFDLPKTENESPVILRHLDHYILRFLMCILNLKVPSVYTLDFYIKST